MKVILFTLVSTLLLFTAHGQFDVKKLMAAREKCGTESGFDLKTAIKELEEEAGNKEFKCFLKCMMTELEAMDDAGKVLEENIKSLHPHVKPEVWENVVSACKDVDDADPCEKAYKITVCTMDEIKKLK